MSASRAGVVRGGMYEFQFLRIDAGIFFRPNPWHTSARRLPPGMRRGGGDGEGSSPAPMDHGPCDGDRSQGSAQTKAADLKAAGETALAQGGPGGDDAGHIGRKLRPHLLQ